MLFRLSLKFLRASAPNPNPKTHLDVLSSLPKLVKDGLLVVPFQPELFLDRFQLLLQEVRALLIRHFLVHLLLDVLLQAENLPLLICHAMPCHASIAIVDTNPKYREREGGSEGGKQGGRGVGREGEGRGEGE